MQYSLRPLRKKSTALYVAGTVLLASLVTLAMTSSVFAAHGIMLQVKDAPLREVVMLLTQQSGTNIVIADESKLEKKVTAYLNDVPLEKALDYIVKGAGISYRKMDDGTYIIGGAITEDTPVLSPKELATVLPPVEPVAPPAPKEKIVTSIRLIHSKPSELLALMGWQGRNPMPNCETVYPDRLTKSSDHPQSTDGGIHIYNNQGNEVANSNGKAPAIQNQPVAPTIDPRGYNSGAGRTADVYDGAAQYPQPPGYAQRPSGYMPGGAQPPSQQGRTNNSSNSNNQNFLWPEGIDQAVPFDLDNSIIVKGDEDGIQKFKNIVRMLDVPPKQVQIKAEFVEVTTTDVKKFGIDWSLNRLNESFNAALSSGGNVTLAFATGNLTANLQAQLTSDIGRVINAPIISTINNQNAYISIVSEIPYWVSMNTIVGDGQIINQSTPQFIEIDTHLNVLPRVNGDNTITMILSPGVADTGAMTTGPDGTQIPEQREQELFTQRRVANGETIVVGGFIRKNDSNNIIKIPILADLPIVGSLFRGTSKTTEDRELLIFVTPTIIPDTGSGSIAVGGNLVP